MTDDNSTFFLARPADFGPGLASNGLSGQIWVGNGFSNSDRGGEENKGEGELGCSDVPGWDEVTRSRQKQLQWEDTVNKQQLVHEANNGNTKRTEGGEGHSTTSDSAFKAALDNTEPSEDDGTDDFLHHPLPTSSVSKQSKPGESAEHEPKIKNQAATHGDIQSLQESAEIAGKVALLSRGGCGFLEKVKWAQRRGAIALIVGDHTRGGALVTMYARGDTSNVSIPSVFTSHTTAHLLASLLPPESAVVREDSMMNDKSGSRSNTRKQLGTKVDDNDRPTFTPLQAPKSTSRSSMRPRKAGASSKLAQKQSVDLRSSWLRSILGFGDSDRSSVTSSDRTRPPSSGRLDWLTPKWSDKTFRRGNTESRTRDSQANPSEVVRKEPSKSNPLSILNDDFVIGVQDWRDPDVVVPKSSGSTSSQSSSITQSVLSTPSTLNKAKTEDESKKGLGSSLSGGSITPGSGEYNKPDLMAKQPAKDNSEADGNEDHYSFNVNGKMVIVDPTEWILDDFDEEHEGLWVTITPTTISSSPFFDTLLVLVVSPLVTLTVVYALLLLRSRIRRRRWRAPRSVVDRLPIRTYHTMSCTSTASSTRYSTPRNHSPVSEPTQSSLCLLTGSRPRSAASSGVANTTSVSLDRAMQNSSSNERSHLLGKKRYQGRSVECVVCLEEYVDGKSKVMSLPCGHEFHAECM